LKNNLKTIKIRDFAILVSSILNKHNIDAVLVGGACVSIYSGNKYMSSDLDYVTAAPTDRIAAALKTLGFIKKGNIRQFVNGSCPFFIEFPPGPVSIGKEILIKKFNKIKSLKLLTATDCVKDRLAAFYHWNDLQSLGQAIMVAKAQKVNLKIIEKWSKNENSPEKFKRFLYLLKK